MNSQIEINGKLYEVTMTYDEAANFPEGSTLRVTEFSEGDAEYEYARNSVLAEKTAVNNLAEQLAQKKNSAGEPLVRMSLIQFSTKASTVLGLTDLTTDGKNNGLSKIKAAVNGLTANGGTNWDHAFQLANEENDLDPGRATFVIFVTDGDPTFRNTRMNVTDADLAEEKNYYAATNTYTEPNYWYLSDTVYGPGNNDRTGQCYAAAVQQGNAIVSAGKNIYTIGISNDVTKVAEGTTTESGTISESNKQYTVTYTNKAKTQHVIIRKTGQDGTTLLSGAVFSLYTESGYHADPKTASKTGLTSGQNGLIDLGALPYGKYYLAETSAPAGYILLSEPVEIMVAASGVTYNQSGSNLSKSGYGVSYDSAMETYTLTVTNNAGYELPSTGGPGTRLFTILGSTLILGAGVLLWRRRRMM